jgi:hypothetical protein
MIFIINYSMTSVYVAHLVIFMYILFVLSTDLESWHQLENGDKWYSFSEDDEKIIEGHISTVR